MEDGSKYGYAWLVFQCTAVLSQVRVTNSNSARASTAEAHALKLLATQRGNVRSSNIAYDSKGKLGPTTVQVPRKGFLERYRSTRKAQVFVSTAGLTTYVVKTVGSPWEFASVLALKRTFGNY